MRHAATLREWLDRWLSVREPVTYWSFWRDLLKLTPVLLGLFAVAVGLLGVQFSLRSFAPVPFVFVAATAGFAVRELTLSGGVASMGLGALYGAVLWVTDAGWLLLSRPSPVLSAVAVLTFVALVAGFSAPALHGRRGGQEFEAAYRRHRLGDDD